MHKTQGCWHWFPILRLEDSSFPMTSNCSIPIPPLCCDWFALIYDALLVELCLEIFAVQGWAVFSKAWKFMDGFSILGGFSGRFVWHPDLRFLCSFRRQFPFPTI